MSSYDESKCLICVLLTLKSKNCPRNNFVAMVSDPDFSRSLIFLEILIWCQILVCIGCLRHQKFNVWILLDNKDLILGVNHHPAINVVSHPKPINQAVKRLNQLIKNWNRFHKRSHYGSFPSTHINVVSIKLPDSPQDLEKDDDSHLNKPW